MSTDTPKDKHCDYNNYKRARYFHGMLMTDRDFKEEQSYHNEKRRLLNRMLHGWGVVCGLKIEPSATPCSHVTIGKGLALDCKGEEIYVCEPIDLDVSTIVKPCAKTTKRPLTAKECEEMEKEKTGSNKWYVVIRYHEVSTDPVPVYAPGGGCEEKVCEYSRIREGYCVDLVKTVECPERLREDNGPCETWQKVTTTSSAEDKEPVRNFLCENLLMTCPGECCDKPTVVLGSIDLGAQSGEKPVITAKMINNWDCRRYVITFGLLQYWMLQLSPAKLPFEAIVDYTALGDACINDNEAVTTFRKLCKKGLGQSRIGPDEWIVHGRVLHSSGRPAPRLRVDVLDRDKKYDDLLRVATTDEDGYFAVVYNRRDFAEMGEKEPDLYVEVWDAQRKNTLYSSVKNVRYEAGRTEYFEINLAEQQSERARRPRKSPGGEGSQPES